MEPQQQQSAGGGGGNNEEGGVNNGGKGGYMCRQSSTRWTPTSDQIRILKELYYNNGVRSPNAEQIQRISARLRQYGKIEGKNVFYWFQNHKARERQKKRFTSDHHPHTTIITTNNPIIQTHLNNSSSSSSSSATITAAAAANTNIHPPPWKPDHHHLIHHPNPHYSHINIPSSAGVSPASSSSAGMVTLGQMGNYGYGSVTMEKCFRDCSISAGGSIRAHNLGWTGVDPYSSSYTNFLDKMRPSSDQFETLKMEEEHEEQEEAEHEDDDDDDEGAREIETLPLFPMHGEDIHGFCNIKSAESPYYSAAWYHHHHHHHHHALNNNNNASHRTSLELTLNSYMPKSPDSTS